MDRPECSENQQRQATGVRKPPAPAGFFKKGMLYGDSGQSRVVVSARQQHALLHAALNLALKRFFIAPEGVTSENGIYGHSRFCNTDFDDKLACLNLSGV